MREEEERLREKVLQTAGIVIPGGNTSNQAPVASLGSRGHDGDKKKKTEASKHEGAVPPKSPGGEEGFASSQRANGNGFPALAASGNNIFAEGQENVSGGGSNGGGGADGHFVSGMVAESNFDVESDVQKRVLDLVRRLRAAETVGAWRFAHATPLAAPFLGIGLRRRCVFPSDTA